MTKILEWIETDTQYIGVLQPKDIFDEKSFVEDGRYEVEAVIKGRLKSTGEIYWYALAYDKGKIGLEDAKRFAASVDDIASAPIEGTVTVSATSGKE